LLEFVQLLTPDRDGRIQDLIEKMAGGALGIVIWRAIASFGRANRWFGVPSRPREFHPEPLTDPDLILSHHPARAIDRKLPHSIRNGVPRPPDSPRSRLT